MEIIFLNKRIEKFLRSLEVPVQAQVDVALSILEEYNHRLGMPFSKPLGGGLFELRVISINHIRLIYTFYKGNIWILHGFVKKTERISKQDIEYARRQLKILLQ